MSEKQCNKCFAGKVNNGSSVEVKRVARDLCIDCTLKNNFTKSVTGVMIVNPPVIDDRTIDNVVIFNEALFIDVTALEAQIVAVSESNLSEGKKTGICGLLGAILDGCC